MTLAAHSIIPGSKLISPGGRHIIVSNIIVPKHSPETKVPSRFRNYARKLVLFHNETMATLNEIQHLYRLAE